MIELNEHTSPTVQVAGHAINRVEEQLMSLEDYACADDPEMVLAIAHQMQEKLQHIMSMAAKKVLS